jgi:hypothetical protein
MANKSNIKQLHQLFKDADIIRCVIHGEDVCGYTEMGSERDWDLETKGYYEIKTACPVGDGTDTTRFPVDHFDTAFEEETSVWLLKNSKGLFANVTFFKLTAI